MTYLGKRKLSRAQVSEIKRLLADGIKKDAIAAQFGMHRSSIYYIAQGKTWKGVQPA